MDESSRCWFCLHGSLRLWSVCSFSTSKDTKDYLSKSHADLINEPDVELVQNKSPKVDAKTLEPATFPEDPEQEW